MTEAYLFLRNVVDYKKLDVLYDGLKVWITYIIQSFRKVGNPVLIDI